eukprot:scaffold2881_cov113-Skeletonema_marinoi.AAC.2
MRLLQQEELCIYEFRLKPHLLCLCCICDDGCYAFVDVGGSVQRWKCHQDHGCSAFVDVGGSVQRWKCHQDLTRRFYFNHYVHYCRAKFHSQQ